jgi:hypothetical protein
MIAHHYGMFDFNTEEPENIDAAVNTTTDIAIHRARTEVAFVSRALTY